VGWGGAGAVSFFICSLEYRELRLRKVLIQKLGFKMSVIT